MINILYLFVTLPIGGAEEHLLTVLKNLDLTQYNPTVCCIREKGVIGEEIENRGIAIISLNRKSKSWDFRIIMDILRIIQTKNIHLIHTHLYHANMYGRIAALISKIPAVVTEHNVYPMYKFKRRIINWLLAKKTNKIIAVSNMVKDYIVSRDWIAPSGVEVVYNGIDIAAFDSSIGKKEARERLGLDKDTPLIGIVARLSRQKGHVYLFRAMAMIREEVPDARLIVVGSGPLEQSLKEEVSMLGIDSAVSFLGARRDVPVILKAMDLFVLPSMWEGFPVALLEAMASGLPVVAASVGGVGEVVKDGETGFLVQPKDEESLGRRIISLLEDEEKSLEFGANGKRLVEGKFSSVSMVKHLEYIYNSVIQNKNG